MIGEYKLHGHESDEAIKKFQVLLKIFFLKNLNFRTQHFCKWDEERLDLKGRAGQVKILNQPHTQEKSKLKEDDLIIRDFFLSSLKIKKMANS